MFIQRSICCTNYCTQAKDICHEALWRHLLEKCGTTLKRLFLLGEDFSAILHAIRKGNRSSRILGHPYVPKTRMKKVILVFPTTTPMLKRYAIWWRLLKLYKIRNNKENRSVKRINIINYGLKAYDTFFLL